MKVTLLLPRLDMTGGNRVCSIYAQMLHRAGHSVVVVVAGAHRQSIKSQLSRFFRGEGVSKKAIPRKSHFDGLGLEIIHLDTYRPITDYDVPDADIVMATWWETAEWAWALSEKKGKKIYLVQHHELFDGLPLDRVRATYLLPMKKIVVAEWLRDVMLNEYGSQDVDLVPNGVDQTQFFAPRRTKQQRPTLGFMSSLAEFKAVDVAVRAILEISRSIDDLQVCSFGHEMIGGLESLKASVDFRQRPSQEYIRDCYSRCDVWLTSSRSEGFNLPALEAMACRTPVVSTRTGWPATAIVDGSNGYLADVGNWFGLAEGAIRILQCDATEWSELSDCAFRTALPNTWDRIFPRLEEILLRAANRY